MSRAPWVVQKPEKGFPAGPQTMHSHDARLAHGQPGDARPVDDLARREHREARGHPQRRPRGAGRVRAAQPPAGRQGLGRGLLRRLGHPGPTRARRATRASAPTARLEKLAKLKPAFVKDGTVTAGNASPAQRRRRRRADRRESTQRQRRSRGSPAAAPTPSTPTSSASAPSRRRTRRCNEPASPGTTSTWSSSTRPSPRSRSPA